MNDVKRDLKRMGAVVWESDTLPSDVKEQFLRNVLAHESAPQTTLFQQLLDAGCELPGPEALADSELTAKLWNMIDALALLRVFIGYTDHLSDRELYTRLWSDVLRQEIPILPVDPRAAWHLDLLGSGSEDDTNSYLKYYADDEDRRRWLVQFPDYAIPPRENLPYDRDQFLRRAD
jgi:hypothetical protein